MTLSINCVSPSSVFLFFFFVSHVAAAVVVDGRSLLMAEARVTLPPTPELAAPPTSCTLPPASVELPPALLPAVTGRATVPGLARALPTPSLGIELGLGRGLGSARLGWAWAGLG